MNIPLEELPGCVKQGESPPEHHFTLLTLDQLFGREHAEELKALGFSFTPSSSTHAVWRTGNPSQPVIFDTIAQLLHFVEKHGSIIITKDRQAILTGFFPIQQTEPAVVGDYPGYTSVGKDK